MQSLKENFLGKLRGAWKNLIFRRISNINMEKTGCFLVRNSSFDKSLITHSDGNIDTSTLDKNTSLFCDYFEGKTFSYKIRKNDSFQGALSFCSKNYCEINWENGTLNLDYKPYRNVVEVPLIGKLICGIIDPQSRKFIRWFCASEQFLILWTLIIYGTELYPRKNSYSQLIRRLTCNNYGAWLHSKPEVPLEEKKKRFYIIRTEEASKKYFYIYTLLATYLFQPGNLVHGSKIWGETFPQKQNSFLYMRHLLKNSKKYPYKGYS